MKHSSQTFIILMCLIGLLQQTVKAQYATIERHYQTVFYDKTLSCYKDTTCSIIFTLRDGRVVDASICVASYDREHVQAANISFNGNSGFCTPMLRLSEAYLNLTEALMGLYDTEETQNSKLLEGVNTVRRRAYSYEIANGGYPGDYGTTGTFNLDSLLQERRMEFFVEGLYWSDIVRRSLMGETHLNRMVNYMNNRLFEVEGDSIMGSHRLYDYKYTAASTTDRIGTVKLNLATDGGYKISRPCHDCVHHIAEGSYCHSQSVGNEDNLWSMVYPPTETTLNPNLLLAPVGYDFTTIIANKKDYRYE